MRVASGQTDEQYVDEQERRAKRLAATFGLCAGCGRDVGADGIHEWSCVLVPIERRANRGRAPAIAESSTEDRDALADREDFADEYARDADDEFAKDCA